MLFLGKKMFDWRHLNNFAEDVAGHTHRGQGSSKGEGWKVRKGLGLLCLPASLSQNKDDPIRENKKKNKKERNRTSAHLNAKGHEKNTTQGLPRSLFPLSPLETSLGGAPPKSPTKSG